MKVLKASHFPWIALGPLFFILAGCQTVPIQDQRHSYATAQHKCTPIATDLAGSYSFKNTSWNIYNSIDTEGYTWNESYLTFVSEVANDGKLNVTGYFDWYLDDIPSGKEYFTGHFIPKTGQIVLQGDYIENAVGIGPSIYKATLCSGGRKITSGTWTAPNIVPGIWSANLMIRTL